MCQIFAVHQLAFNRFRRCHAEFHKCCTTFFALENDKKKRVEKRFPLSRKLANITLIFNGFSIKIRHFERFSLPQHNFIAKWMYYSESALKTASNHI